MHNLQTLRDTVQQLRVVKRAGAAMALQKTDTRTHKVLWVLLKLVLPASEKPNPPNSPSLQGKEGVGVLDCTSRFQGGKGRSKGIGGLLLPSPKRRGVGGEVLGLALFISTLLLSTSVRATPHTKSGLTTPFIRKDDLHFCERKNGSSSNSVDKQG